MSELEARLRELIGMKEGNKELAVFYEPSDDSWSIQLGNPTTSVMLGEVWGEVQGEGGTLEEAIEAALTALRPNTGINRTA